MTFKVGQYLTAEYTIGNPKIRKVLKVHDADYTVLCVNEEDERESPCIMLSHEYVHETYTLMSKLHKALK